jgi:hypothetical protein
VSGFLQSQNGELSEFVRVSVRVLDGRLVSLPCTPLFRSTSLPYSVGSLPLSKTREFRCSWNLRFQTSLQESERCLPDDLH